MTNRGLFIVLEGIDRCGKSTLSKHLVEKLPNSTLFSFPNRTSTTGKILHEYLQNQNHGIHEKGIHLLFSCNRWESQHELHSLLSSGVHVICDRYSLSGQCYSMANGLDRNWCWNSEIGLLKPDLIIYIQLDPLVASTRVGYGDEIYEKLEFQSKVKQAFDSFTDLFVVDGLLKQEKIQEIVWDKVMDLVKEPRIDFFYFTNQHV